MDKIVSALYLQYSMDPFHICTSYQATLEGLSHVKFITKLNKNDTFFKFVTLTLSSFDLGPILINSMGNLEAAGYRQNVGVLVVLVFRLRPCPKFSHCGKPNRSRPMRHAIIRFCYFNVLWIGWWRRHCFQAALLLFCHWQSVEIRYLISLKNTTSLCIHICESVYRLKLLWILSYGRMLNW